MSKLLVCPECGKELFYTQIEPSEVTYLIEDIDADGAADLAFNDSVLIDESMCQGSDPWICCHCGFMEAGTPQEFVKKHPDLVQDRDADGGEEDTEGKEVILPSEAEDTEHEAPDCEEG